MFTYSNKHIISDATMTISSETQPHEFLKMTLFVDTLYNKPIERLATVRGAILLHVVLLKDITASNTKASASNIKATHSMLF